MRDNGAFSLGDPAPFLELPDTRGVLHGLPEAGELPATVVIWTCNECPHALAWHERLMAVARDAEVHGVSVLAINSNDFERHPAESADAMRARVDAGEFACPFLHDGDQRVARSFGARTTPEVFVLDSDLYLRYRGAPDADHESSTEDAAWLRDALDCVIRGARVENPETQPVGCTIKWRDAA